MRHKTTALAVGKWRFILSSFGVDQEFLRNVHGPCPVCGGNDRFRFDDKDGTGSYFCTSCGPGQGMKLLQNFKGWDFKTAAAEVDRLLPQVPAEDAKQSRRDPRPALRRVRDQLQPVGDAVKSYLGRRGFSRVPPGLYQVRRPYYENGKSLGDYDCMVGPVRDAAGLVVTYHLTYIQDGDKAPVASPRKIMTPAADMTGAGIRLAATPGQVVGIAEGIETAIAVMLIFKVPCWSVISESGMRKFQPPAGIKGVRIFADNDRNFVGQRAAYDLAARLSSEGYEVSVNMPEKPGTDYADQILMPKPAMVDL